MLDFLYRLPMHSFPRCRLVPPSRLGVPWGVSFFLPGRLSLLARIVLIRLVPRLVGRLVSRLVLLAHLVLLICVSQWASRHIFVPPSLRLVVSSRRGVLLARLVFFSIRLIILRIWIGRSPCGGCCIISMSMRLVPLLLVRSLLARYVGVVMMRYPCPSCVIRS